MPVHTPQKLAQAQLGSSDGQIYLTPGGTTTTVTAIYITETTGTARTFRLHQVTAAGSSTASNAMFYDHGIGANRTIKDGAGILLTAGQMLRGLASAATAVTVTVFGIETLN